MRAYIFCKPPRPARLVSSVLLGFAMLVFASGVVARDFQFGACVHLALGRSDPATVSRLLQDLGMNSLRDDIYWGPMERQAGRLTVPARLADVRTAFASSVNAGGTSLAILGLANSLYDGGGLIESEAGIAAFNRYVRHVLKEFGGAVDQFEIWNEWNNGFGASPRVAHGDAAQYARLLKSVHATIKAEQKTATVIGGAVAGVDLKWIDAFIDAGGLDALDALSIHSYTLYRAFDVPEGAITSLASVHRRLKAARPDRDIPLLITEMGWPTSTGKHGRPEETVAAYLTRFVLMARAQPWIQGVWWYDLIDDGDKPDNAEHRFGLVRRNGEPKPAYHAARELAPLVRNGTNFRLYRFGLSGLAVRFDYQGASRLVAWRVETSAALWPETMPAATDAPQAIVDATRALARDGIPQYWVFQAGTWRAVSGLSAFHRPRARVAMRVGQSPPRP